MGTCCSKIENKPKDEISCFEEGGVPGYPSLELQLPLQYPSHQNWISDMKAARVHDTCELLAGPAAPSRLRTSVKDLIYGTQACEERINKQSISLSSDNCASAQKLALNNSLDGVLEFGGDTTDYCTKTDQCKKEMLPCDASGGGNHDYADANSLASLSVVTILSLSRRMSACNLHNIDHSDGIKLEVRYKHMFPQDAQPGDGHHHTPSFEGNVLKRARSSDKLVGSADPEGHPLARRYKISRVCVDNHHSISEHGSIMPCITNEEEDDGDHGDGDDDEYHDITSGVSIASFYADHGFATRLGDHGCGESLYVNSQRSAMFMHQAEEREEANMEACIKKTMLPLSVVYTGDAILFSGSNSDELHLIPSFARRADRTSCLSISPNHSFSHSRPSILRSIEPIRERFSLSVEDIILLLDNDELDEDDLLSLLMDSHIKPTSSQSSSPPSSCASSPSSLASSIVWLASPPPLSLSSSSSTSSSSSGPSVLPPLPSCTEEAPQSSPSSSTHGLPTPYSLSLPSSCMNMYSPHTSFDFNVKLGNSAPSTPTFSPIRSRAKGSMVNLKPSALTTEEIVEIWGIFEQKRASMVSSQMRDLP